MTDRPPDLETLFAYWRNELSAAEAEALEARADADPLTAEALGRAGEALERDAGAPQHAAVRRREFVEALDEVRRGHRRTGSLVAGLALLAAALGAVYFLVDPFAPSTDRLFTGAIVPAEDYVTLRGPRDPGPVEAAMMSYAEGAYAETIDRLETFLAMDTTHVAASFYLGVCLLLEDRPGEALRRLEPLAATDDPTYAKEAAWYAALSDWKAGREQEALEAVEAIASRPGPHRGEAERILEAR